MQVSNEGSKAKIAERKSAYDPKLPSFVSSKFTEWDPEQATKLIQESVLSHPRGDICPPCTEIHAKNWRQEKRQQAHSTSHESSANAVLAKTQRRMGRIKMTEEDYKLFVGKELSGKRRK